VMVLLVGILGFSGCGLEKRMAESSSDASLEKIGVNPNPPDMNKLAPYVGNDPTLQFYFKVLSDYQNFFVNLNSRPLTEQEKQKELKDFEPIKKEMIDNMIKQGVAKHQAYASADLVNEETLKHKYILSELPPMANRGERVDAKAITNSTVISSSDVKIANVDIIYQAASLEDAQTKMRELRSILTGFLSHDPGWQNAETQFNAQIEANKDNVLLKNNSDYHNQMQILRSNQIKISKYGEHFLYTYKTPYRSATKFMVRELAAIQRMQGNPTSANVAGVNIFMKVYGDGSPYGKFPEGDSRLVVQITSVYPVIEK